ncbi:MAG: hypothetical protein PHR36_04050 [Patescibacteria group bacterium]|nr:hypothetical protein [Patescibacteria group bacterium]
MFNFFGSREKGPEISSGEEKLRRELETRRESLHAEDQELLRESKPADLDTHNKHWKLYNRVITLDTFLEPGNSGLSRGELMEKVHSEMGTAFIRDVFEEEMDEIEKTREAA